MDPISGGQWTTAQFILFLLVLNINGNQEVRNGIGLFRLVSLHFDFGSSGVFRFDFGVVDLLILTILVL